MTLREAIAKAAIQLQRKHPKMDVYCHLTPETRNLIHLLEAQ